MRRHKKVWGSFSTYVLFLSPEQAFLSGFSTYLIQLFEIYAQNKAI